MNSQYTYKTAIPVGMGNQQNLAQIWIGFIRDPANRQKINTLAEALDEVLRERIPNKTLGGLFAGKEQEIRQDALLLLLLDKFLAGNRQLLHVTRKGIELQIHNQIQRSTSAAIIYSRRRLRHELTEEMRRWVSLPDDDDQWGAVLPLPSRSAHPLPYPVLLELALIALQRAVEQKRLSKTSAALAAKMFDEGITQAEMARRMGTSRSAIHQRLEPVRRHLQTALHNQEFPRA